MARTNATTQSRRGILRACAVLLVAFAPLAAHAQWKVVDTDANRVLGTKTNGNTINQNLDAINKKLIIGTNNKDSPGKRMEDPTSKLPAPDDATASKLDNGDHCKAVATAQQKTCNAIVDIENAQYKYMLTVYKTSATRQEMLQKLLDERDAIKDNANQYGMLESNSNKLMALYNLIALDRQQMESVNYAYEANLRYLRASQAMDAQAAQSGTPRSSLGSLTIPGMGDIDLGSLINAAVTGLTLKAALEVAQSNKPDDMHRLSIGKSNGW